MMRLLHLLKSLYVKHSAIGMMTITRNELNPRKENYTFKVAKLR